MALALPGAAHGGQLDERAWIDIGAFDPTISSTVQINNASNGLAGTRIAGEDDLGLAKRKTVPSLLIGARIDERWRFEFGYFALKRSANQTVLSGNLNFDNLTFPVAASVASTFESTIYRASAGYSLLRTPDAEAGLVLGVHVTDFKVALAGVASVDGAPLAQASREKSKTLPLLTAGLYGTVALTPGWVAGGRIDYFQLNHGGYADSFTNAQLNLLYRFTPNFAAGIGYRYDDYRLKASSSTLDGTVEYQFRGPQLMLRAAF
jgi:hypothetical protein